MTAEGWGPATDEHRFESGRTATIRRSPNVYAIFAADDIAPHLSDYMAGEIADPALGLRISEEIVRAMLVAPRLLRDDDPDVPGGVRWIDLDPQDIDELLGLFMEGSMAAARFRGEPGGADGGDGRPDVGNKPKPAARAKARKR
jgi:hypothetical protein